MKNCCSITLVLLFVLGSGGWAFAEPDRMASLEQQFKQLKQHNTALQEQVAVMQQQLSNQAVDQHRAAAIQAAARQAVSDAQTRPGLMPDDAIVGFEETFLMRSADGKFSLAFGGLAQFRYEINHRNPSGAAGQNVGENAWTNGFEFANVKLGLSGHVGDPMLSWEVELEADAGNIALSSAAIGYDVMDGLAIVGGTGLDIPGTQEQMVGDSEQLGIGRSYINEVLGFGSGTGVAVDCSILDRVHGMSFLYSSDEVNGQNNFGFASRVDVKLLGDDWALNMDLNGQQSDRLTMFAGAAVDFRYGNNASNAVSGADEDDWMQVQFAVDSSLQVAGFKVLGAMMGRHYRQCGDYWAAGGQVVGSSTDMGFLAQGSYNFQDMFEPYVRVSVLIPDGRGASRIWAGNQGVGVVSVGANYFIRGQSVRLTVQAIAATAAIQQAGAGLMVDQNPDASGQFAVVGQFQLMF